MIIEKMQRRILYEKIDALDAAVVIFFTLIMIYNVNSGMFRALVKPFSEFYIILFLLLGPLYSMAELYYLFFKIKNKIIFSEEKFIYFRFLKKEKEFYYKDIKKFYFHEKTHFFQFLLSKSSEPIIRNLILQFDPNNFFSKSFTIPNITKKDKETIQEIMKSKLVLENKDKIIF